jgi:hypothetical protein
MEELPWFAALTAQQRAEAGLVVQGGLAAFADWVRDPSGASLPGPELFAVAPRELARSITLKQTVQLIRIVVDVLERSVPTLVEPGDEAALTEAVLRYSREVAFGAAEVYAASAEARGAWDARVEAGVVEALVRGEVGELTLSRAAALGWQRPDWVAVLVSGPHGADGGPDALRVVARHLELSVLAGEVLHGLLLVVGGTGDPRPALERLAEVLPEGPVVFGPVVPDLASAAGPVAEAVSGLAAAPAWPDAPRPVSSGDLLVERVLLGDEVARFRLLEEVYEPLAAAGGDLRRTVATFVEGGGSVEGTGRALFLHPNTVRYRLKKVMDILSLDPAVPRDAQVLRVALALGRMSIP